MRLAALSCVFVLVACGGEKAPAADSAAAAMPAPAAITLADVAGTWSTVAMAAEGSDSVLVTSEITITADGVGSTTSIAGRPAVPVQIAAGGDSITTSQGPFESVLTPGLMVTTNGVSRLVDGKMVGRMVAHYAGVKTADSVRHFRTVGTRKP